MVAPSDDFQETTSRVVSLKSFHCAATSLRYLGAKSEVEETNTSAKWLGAAPTPANVRWSLVKVAPGSVELLRPADPLDGARGWVEAEDVRVGLLQGAEVDAVGSPVDQVGVLVEILRQHARRAALGRESPRCSGWRSRRTAGRSR